MGLDFCCRNCVGWILHKQYKGLVISCLELAWCPAGDVTVWDMFLAHFQPFGSTWTQIKYSCLNCVADHVHPVVSTGNTGRKLKDITCIIIFIINNGSICFLLHEWFSVFLIDKRANRSNVLSAHGQCWPAFGCGVMWFSRDALLCVICVTIEADTVESDDVSER